MIFSQFSDLLLYLYTYPCSGANPIFGIAGKFLYLKLFILLKYYLQENHVFTRLDSLPVIINIVFFLSLVR